MAMFSPTWNHSNARSRNTESTNESSIRLRFLNLLPLSHVFGQFLGLFVPQALGATVIFHDSLNPAEVIRTIREERASVLIAVPRMLESLRQKIERDMEERGELEAFSNSSRQPMGNTFARWWMFRRIHSEFGWKFWAFISGGAALDEETERFWSRLAFAVVQGYGLTETTSLISVNHPFKVGKRSIGKVLPGREMKLDPERARSSCAAATSQAATGAEAKSMRESAKTAGSTPAISANSTPKAISISRDARRTSSSRPQE